MTKPTPDDASLRRVWIAFADQFLDSETRDDLPLAALAAVEAGLTVEEARDVWRHEVVPVVGGNLSIVGGAWGCWDEEWLVAQIRAVRRQTGVLGWLERHGSDPNKRSWRVIARCMQALLSVERDRRTTLARDLSAIACIYFDIRQHRLAPARREELRRLFREVFTPIFAEVVYATAGESKAARVKAAEARVEAALAAFGAGPGEAGR
jgi:hypothetical protein